MAETIAFLYGLSIVFGSALLILLIFLPFFVLKIRNEVVELNKRVGLMVGLLGGQLKEPSAGIALKKKEPSAGPARKKLEGLAKGIAKGLDKRKTRTR